MNAAVESIRSPAGTPRVGPAPALAGGLVLVLLATSLALALYRFPPSWAVVAAVSLGLTAVLALAVARYEAAVALGFLLFSVVRMEPAPPDAVFAIVIAVAVVTGRLNLARVPLALVALVGGLLVLNLLSTVEAVDPAAAARFLAITVYLALFSLWLTGYLDSTRRARAIVRAYLLGAVVFALLASLALYAPLPGAEELLAFEGTRAQGLFEDPNVFGPFLVPAALIVLHELLSPRLLRSGRLVKVAMFIILVAGVLFSYSRAAWLNFAVAVLVLLTVLALRRGGGRKALAVLVVLLVSGIATIGVISVTGSLGFLQDRAQFQTYDVERFGAQQTGIQLAEQYPFGIGPGQFDVVVPVSTHSTYVRALAEQGILGLVTMVGITIATLVLAGRNAVLGRDTHGIGSAVLLGAWVGLVVNSFFVDTLHWRHLWLVAALVWVGTRRPASELGERPVT